MCLSVYRRIYFNNHKECYFKQVHHYLIVSRVMNIFYSDGCNGVPHKLYQLIQNDGSKIWAVISYHCHIVRLVCFHHLSSIF